MRYYEDVMCIQIVIIAEGYYVTTKITRQFLPQAGIDVTEQYDDVIGNERVLEVNGPFLQ